MQGKHPIQSVILCESRESRNIISQAWTPLCSEGDECEWAARLGPFDRLRDRPSFATVSELVELAVISCAGNG